MAFEEIQDIGWYIVLALIIVSVMIMFLVAFQPTIREGWLSLIANVMLWLVSPV
jgi:hypothetical protein